ncbi:UTP21 [Hepatospora eriocheir]|uniref:UTP21 n=1 Tax=Hepatospora eriocheir TaxID=1081669 RepID=A0A1X0QGN4_9MICR|nr:UTP21 [Hepatospora eriocheir]
MKFEYFRTLNRFSHGKDIQLSSITDIPYLLIPLDFSFYIYDLQNLTIQFYVKLDFEIEHYCFNKWEVFVSNKDKVYCYIRGEQSYVIEFKENIKYIHRLNLQNTNNNYVLLIGLVDNTTFLINDKNTITKLNLDISVKKVINYIGYDNKIVIQSENRLLIYNVKKDSIIFQFNEKITDIFSTDIPHIFVIKNEDKGLVVFNMKEAKTIKTIDKFIKEEVDSVTIRSNHLIVNNSNSVIVYELNNMRKIFSIRQTKTKASFINKDLILIISSSFINIYMCINNKLTLYKSKNNKNLSLFDKNDQSKVFMDQSKRYKGEIDHNTIKISDVVSNTVCDTLYIKNVESCFFKEKLKFLYVLRNNNDIDLYYDKDLFSRKKKIKLNEILLKNKKVENKTETEMFILDLNNNLRNNINENKTITKVRSNLYKDISLYKDCLTKYDTDFYLKSLDKEEVNNLIRLIRDEDEAIFLLNKLFLYKSKKIDDVLIESNFLKYKILFDRYEEIVNILKMIKK